MLDAGNHLHHSPRAHRLSTLLTADGRAPLQGLVEGMRMLPGVPTTLLCVCPVTPAVVRAALRVAEEEDFPLVFAATLNQVDRKGGYTGWTPDTFRRFLESASHEYALSVPILAGLDHGGPWCRDDTQDLPLAAAMQAVQTSIEASLDAGYAHLHIDATLDPARSGGTATTEATLLRTVSLIAHAEAYRAQRSLPPVSYEVSAERESGAHVEAARVEAFVQRLVGMLHERGVPIRIPLFTVANLGTDLHSPTFDAGHARALAGLLRPHGTHLKGHFTDFVADLNRYPASGVAAANLGPELAAVEYRRLCLLSDIARKQGRDVPLESTVIQLLDASERWRKWLLPGETIERLPHLPQDRQAQIVETASRYVLNDPRITRLRRRLYEAVADEVEPESFVLDELLRTIRRYAQAFNLSGLAGRLLASQ